MMRRKTLFEIQNLTKTEQLSIKKLNECLIKFFHLHGLILFGSKARGDHQEWSDVDLLVLVEEEKNWNNREKSSDITLDINMEFDTQLNCFLEHVGHWEKEEEPIWLPLKDNIDQEGIAIEI